MRYTFGGSIADWTFATVDTGEVNGLAQIRGGAEVTFWSARDGGEQYTDLLDSASVPITSVFTQTDAEGSAAGQIPQFKGPDGVTAMWASADGGPRALIYTYDLPAHVHDASEITSGVLDPARLPPGTGGGTGDPGIVWVAAADAPAEFIAAAQYKCDGVDDHVQIQAAIDEAAGTAVVRLSPGTFQLGAPVRLEGGQTSMVRRVLIGYGAPLTNLVAAPGIYAAIELRYDLSVHVADLTITVDGPTHGIGTFASGDDSPNLTNSVIANLDIRGGQNAEQTGWGMYLDSPSKSIVQRVNMLGVANGIRIFSRTKADELNLSQISIDLSGANRRGISIESLDPMTHPSGIHVKGLEITADDAGCEAIVLDGSGNGTVSNCTFRLDYCSWIDRLLTVRNGYRNHLDVGYAELFGVGGSTGILMDADSFDNSVNVGDWYVGANMVLINDANTYAPQSPNRVDRASLWTEAVAVVTYVPNPARTTLLTEVTDSGDGNISAVRRTPLARAPHAVINLGNSSAASSWVLDGARGTHWRITANSNFTLSNPINLVDGQMIYLDVTQDATGGRTMTLGSKFRFSATFPNATLSTAANKKDKLAFQYNAVDDRLDIVYFVKGI